MRIESPGAIRSAAGPRKNERGTGARGSDFRSLLETGEIDAGPAGVSAASGVATLFALQEVEEPGKRNARSAKRGQGILDRLEELRLGLLDGSVSEQTILELKAMARSQSDGAHDPRLQEILGEIELRAEVELAKLAQRRAASR